MDMTEHDYSVIPEECPACREHRAKIGKIDPARENAFHGLFVRFSGLKATKPEPEEHPAKIDAADSWAEVIAELNRATRDAHGRNQ